MRRTAVYLTLRIALVSLFFCCGTSLFSQSVPSHKTENVIFVMTDGLRWQEVFRGADLELMNKKYGKVADVDALKKTYWRSTREERRAVLMPFFWTLVSRQGQVFGNRDEGAAAEVTNHLNFSYPGYSETLCGFADPRVKSNEKIANPNTTVLEWLQKKNGFEGRLAAFGAWDVFPFIFNADRAGFPINAGYTPFTLIPRNPRLDALNLAKRDAPKVWDEEPFDWIPFHTALEYLKERKPRVLFVSLGETDDWAHDGRYGEYLDAAHRVDEFLKILWETAQSMPEYRDRTTLIFSPDHGRGDDRKKWRDHGETIPESKFIWMGFLGPDTAPLGQRNKVPVIRQNQIAATLAALLGENYHAEIPQSGEPIVDVLSSVR